LVELRKFGAQLRDNIPKLLCDLLKTGKLKGPLTGEQIFSLFRRIGLPVRLKTKIRILESGELKTIADKLKEK
jgi:DNA-binding TFAR19-related protein (PDSD5 family)